MLYFVSRFWPMKRAFNVENTSSFAWSWHVAKGCWDDMSVLIL